MYSRQTQKLIYWIIGCFSNAHNGKKANDKVNKIDMENEKENLNNEFLKVYQDKYIKQPIEYFLKVLEDKDIIEIEDLKLLFLNSLQSLLLTKKKFSLSLPALTQAEANDIVERLYKLALENGIELRKEINDLFYQQQAERYIFISLLKKSCAVCWRKGELDHWDNVTNVGGYKHDTGLDTRFICLCREHHTIKHNLGRNNFEKRYGFKGIYLNQKQVEMLAPVYKNHFKANEELK